jgi:hypothetical protein
MTSLMDDCGFDDGQMPPTSVKMHDMLKHENNRQYSLWKDTPALSLRR